MSHHFQVNHLTIGHPHYDHTNSISTRSGDLIIARKDHTALHVHKDGTTLYGKVQVDKNDGAGSKDVLTKADLALANVVTGQTQVAAGSATQTGSYYFVKASPSPVAMIDELGRIDSFNVWHQNWQPYILGFSETAKAALGKVYAHGLVPEGSATHESKFLRKDGQWAQMSSHTGSVAENFLSLNDTPSSYTENAYLQVKFDTSFPSGAGLVQTHALDNVTTLTASGVVKAQSFICTSDRRAKMCIEPLQNCLETVNKLTPVQYAYRSDPKRKTQGVIAQDIQQIPELAHIVVESGDADKTLAVDYTAIISSLVGCVQQLTKEISNLKSELATIAARIPSHHTR